MHDQMSYAALFLQPLAMTISLVYFYGVFARWHQSEHMRGVLTGVLFAVAVVIAMSTPLALASDVSVDLRNLFIGLAGALFGWVAGLIALGVGVALLFWMGGSSILPAMAAMMLAAGLAMVWRYQIQHRVRTRPASLAILGGLVSTHMLVALTMPAQIRHQILFDVGLVLTLCNLAGALLLGSMIDREELLVSNARKLRNDAQTDPLTGLMNRRHLEEVFATLRPSTSPLKGRAMICFDIDNFKTINDKHGHAAGDTVLRTISERLSGCLRPGDLYSRMGGDEFLIVLPEIWQSGAHHVADRCREAIADQSISASGKRLDVTVSLGVHWTTSDPDFEAEIALADAALYLAKEQGRNCVAYRAEASQHGAMQPAA